jgi:hypothetical protein
MMVNRQDPVHAAIPPGRTAGRTAAGLPPPRLAFTGRFSAPARHPQNPVAHPARILAEQALQGSRPGKLEH